jgi:multiple antibiotic resistance protein
MPLSELALTALVTLFIAIGPLETAAVFSALTAGVHRPERRQLAWRGVLVGGVVLVLFAVGGEPLLRALHVSIDAFRVAGGILLLLLAVDLIFAHPSGLSSITPGEEREARRPGDIAVFPLAFPLIAGPGGLTAAVLLMSRTEGRLVPGLVVLGCLAVCLLATYVALVGAAWLHKVLGTTGTNVVARLSGVVLSALAVQFIFDGLRGARLFGA